MTSRQTAKSGSLATSRLRPASIVDVTRESSAGATETTRAVQDLVGLSEELTSAIERFRTRDGDRRPRRQ